MTGRLMPSFTTWVMGGSSSEREYILALHAPDPSGFVYDPTRPDFQANAHAIYRVLRDEHPVYQNPATDIWALSRYRRRARRRDRYDDASPPRTPTSRWASCRRSSRWIRRATTRCATSSRARSRAGAPTRWSRASARSRARLIDRFAARGEADLMAELARHLPSLVIGEMIGVPEDRREAFLDWTEAMVETGAARRRDHPGRDEHLRASSRSCSPSGAPRAART